MDQIQDSKAAKSFKDTLNLPQTDFPIRPNHKEDDPKLLARWSKEDLYRSSFELNKSKEKYILHDGPPYANGNIHLGHAYNKILKDIVTKSRRMVGFQVPVTPGWDCHGLPIEQKVAAENPGLKGEALKRACRDYATKWINIQRQEFKDLGVLMDFDRPYITMSPQYEAATVRALGVLVSKGFMSRKNKTVPWCPTDQTVLAAAEIEYKDRKDPSIYVQFGLENSKKLFPEIDQSVSLLIWTTTPWTLPLNQAVLVSPNAKYVLMDINNNYVIVGALVADKIAAMLGVDKKIIKEFDSKDLVGFKAHHPFIDKTVPLIFDESVGITDGTAFVHCAPGCGPIDYEIGVKNKLPIFSPISSDGKYTDDIIPNDLIGMPVADGQIWVIKKLAERGAMLYKTSIHHSYPHCWRCRNGLIFRATPQWFFNLEREGIKDKALNAINNIEFIPAQGRNFLKATVESRWEWCLSRQRTWGVPIPAILCENCDYSYLSADLVEKVAAGIEKNGIEYWDQVELKDLIDANFSCPDCGSKKFKKEHDILDVWFDAGVSHYAVLYNNKELAFPASIYLEGVDQHRGWFQSSLLTSLVLEDKPCMKTIMTHGYTVDAKGQKMSKSLGNVVAPQDIIKTLGTDGLRLWVASIGVDSDPIVSEVLLRNVAEVYRKIRNTCRFALQNLYDFDISRDAVKANELQPIDQYALIMLSELNSEIIQDYMDSNFTKVFHKLADYCASELSSFYLDIIKDRLYVEKSNGQLRRSAQTALWHILDTLTRLIAPIMSFTAELISDSYQKDKKLSIHLQQFNNLINFRELCCNSTEPLWPAEGVERIGQAPFITEMHKKESAALNFDLEWAMLKEVRSLILKSIELERQKGLIKHSLEASVKLFVNLEDKKYEILKKLFALQESHPDLLINFFKEFLIVSQFQIMANKGNLGPTDDKSVFVSVEKAIGVKCPRCWNYDTSEHPDDLCRRCQFVLKS